MTDDEMNTFMGRVKELNTCVAQLKAEVEQLTAERDKLQAKLEKVTNALHGGYDTDV